MPPVTSIRRRALALALVAGFGAPSAFAGQTYQLEDTVVTDVTEMNQGAIQLVADEVDAPAPISDPPAPVPVAEPTDAPAPIVQASEMAAPMATSCNCCSTPCCTKKQKEGATAAMKGAYKGVFYANDFSYLNDPCYDGPEFIGDCLKGPLL